MTKVTIVDIVPWEFLIIQSLESSSEKAYRKVSYIRRLQMSRGGSRDQMGGKEYLTYCGIIGKTHRIDF